MACRLRRPVSSDGGARINGLNRAPSADDAENSARFADFYRGECCDMAALATCWLLKTVAAGEALAVGLKQRGSGRLVAGFSVAACVGSG